MRPLEVSCFADALNCPVQNVRPFDLLSGVPSQIDLDSVDVVLIGGSGKYSATANDSWLERAFDVMRNLHEQSKPTFASCWGFQAMARALGGSVVHDLENAELGVRQITLTDAGNDDPVFGPVGPSFVAMMGHEDRVVSLPGDAVLLATSNRVENQAFRFTGKPIYCTQFHPELDREHFLNRVRAYPEYIQRIEGVDYDTFASACTETPAARSVMLRFVQSVFG
jgi:GMP synthase (glutamine-hydrolysing)